MELKLELTIRCHEGIREIKMPKIDNMYDCANYQSKAQNLNLTCRMGNEVKRCILIENSYSCNDFKEKYNEQQSI